MRQRIRSISIDFPFTSDLCGGPTTEPPGDAIDRLASTDNDAGFFRFRHPPHPSHQSRTGSGRLAAAIDAKAIGRKRRIGPQPDRFAATQKLKPTNATLVDSRLLLLLLLLLLLRRFLGSSSSTGRRGSVACDRRCHADASSPALRLRFPALRRTRRETVRQRKRERERGTKFRCASASVFRIFSQCLRLRPARLAETERKQTPLAGVGAGPNRAPKGATSIVADRCESNGDDGVRRCLLAAVAAVGAVAVAVVVVLLRRLRPDSGARDLRRRLLRPGSAQQRNPQRRQVVPIDQHQHQQQ